MSRTKHSSRTKIVATLGPATDGLAVMTDMVRAGLDVARVNFSHGKHEDHARRIQLVRDAADEVELLDDLLDRLPYNHRAAIVLHFWAGLSHREIADQLDCSPGSVGPWIQRGLKKMRKSLT